MVGRRVACARRSCQAGAMADNEIAGELDGWPALAARAAGLAGAQRAEATARCVGGPLDGREYPLDAPQEGRTLTYTFLHGGPKIQTRYVLTRDEDGRWAYRLADSGAELTDSSR